MKISWRVFFEVLGIVASVITIVEFYNKNKLINNELLTVQEKFEKYKDEVSVILKKHSFGISFDKKDTIDGAFSTIGAKIEIINRNGEALEPSVISVLTSQGLSVKTYVRPISEANKWYKQDDPIVNDDGSIVAAINLGTENFGYKTKYLVAFLIVNKDTESPKECKNLPENLGQGVKEFYRNK